MSENEQINGGAWQQPKLTKKDEQDQEVRNGWAFFIVSSSTSRVDGCSSSKGTELPDMGRFSISFARETWRKHNTRLQGRWTDRQSPP